MKILEGPEYLMTTLMRFHYDRKQNRKSKVFTDINYELELTLPVFSPQQQDQNKEAAEAENNTGLEMRPETELTLDADKFDESQGEIDDQICESLT